MLHFIKIKFFRQKSPLCGKKKKNPEIQEDCTILLYNWKIELLSRIYNGLL